MRRVNVFLGRCAPLVERLLRGVRLIDLREERSLFLARVSLAKIDTTPGLRPEKE